MSNPNAAFPAMVAEGVGLVNAYPSNLQPYLYGPVISSRVLAGSLGGLISKLLGYGSRNQLAAVMQPAAYPLATSATANVQAQSVIQMSQNGNFVATKWGLVATTSSAPGAVSIYDFLIQLRFGRTDFLWAQNPQGIHIGEVLNTVASGTMATTQYPFPKAVLVERASQVTLILTSLTANARTVYFSLHGYYDLDISASAATTPA